jgi:bifunctional UDP-N-acetylglucosamine pyrophosphorylase/glucosamine-1-phosphate N-acetyltransferase
MREAAVIMAAGKGTRMRSELPKVCHVAAGKPLVRWVAEACVAAGIDTLVAVVGYRADVVIAALDGFGARFATQSEQLGTGHAALQARDVLGDEPWRLFVLNGDMPLIDAHTLNAMRETHVGQGAAMTLTSTVPARPLEYGRVIRDGQGRIQAIVEERDCTSEQAAVRELNVGFYVFDAPGVWPVLASLASNNKAGEYYITDMARSYASRGEKVVSVRVPEQVGSGVNTVEQLAWIEGLLTERQTG